jgi:uncharacterized membrane protein YadS
MPTTPYRAMALMRSQGEDRKQVPMFFVVFIVLAVLDTGFSG